jgi:hypothetical protein
MFSHRDDTDFPSHWTKLQNDFSFPNTAKFPEQQGVDLSLIENGTTTIDQAPPSFPAINKTRKVLLVIGIVLAILDLCILPITYFYALTYGSSLTRQYGKNGIYAP